MKLEDVREVVVLEDTILVNKYLQEGWFVIETSKYGSKRCDLEGVMPMIKDFDFRYLGLPFLP